MMCTFFFPLSCDIYLFLQMSKITGTNHEENACPYHKNRTTIFFTSFKQLTRKKHSSFFSCCLFVLLIMNERKLNFDCLCQKKNAKTQSEDLAKWLNPLSLVTKTDKTDDTILLANWQAKI